MGASLQPLVSMIIPVYNQRADFLRECLKSATDQTYANIEIIVSDNHSNNGTAEVLEEFLDGRVRVVKPPQHVDIIDNFIFGAAAASGEYITFLSSDDLLYPECIARVMQPLIENTKLSFSYCENAIIDASGNRKFLVRKSQLPSGIYSKKQAAFRMYNYLEYWIIGGIMPNKLFKKIGFVKEVRAGDWLLGLQLLKYGDVAYCNEVLSAIRFHERKGNAKQAYEEAFILHNIQRAYRHEFIIQDKELLDAIGISQEKAIQYRDKEIAGSVIVLVRQYHKNEINNETVNTIFAAYRQIRSGFHFNFLTRYYSTRMALVYTYILGFFGRIKKVFSSGK